MAAIGLAAAVVSLVFILALFADTLEQGLRGIWQAFRALTRR